MARRMPIAVRATTGEEIAERVDKLVARYDRPRLTLLRERARRKFIAATRRATLLVIVPLSLAVIAAFAISKGVQTGQLSGWGVFYAITPLLGLIALAMRLLPMALHYKDEREHIDALLALALIRRQEAERNAFK